MTMPRLLAEDVAQRKSQKVEAPRRVHGQESYNFTIGQPNHEDDIIRGAAAWDSLFHKDARNANDPLQEIQAQSMLTPCTERSAHNTNIIRTTQCKLFSSQQIVNPKGQERGPNYVQDRNVAGSFVRSHVALDQGDQGQLLYDMNTAGSSHVKTISSQHVGVFGRLMQDVETQTSGSEQLQRSNVDQTYDQHGWNSQDFLRRQGISYQAGCDTGPSGLTAYPQKQFSLTCSGSQIWPGCNAATAGPSVVAGYKFGQVQEWTTSWTGDTHTRVPSAEEQYMQGQPTQYLQSEGLCAQQGFSSSKCLASQNPLLDNIMLQGQTASTQPAFNHGDPYASPGRYSSARSTAECARTPVDQSYHQVGAFAPISNDYAIGCMPCTPASVQDDATVHESPSVDSSPSERVSCVDTMLPSSLQNMEALDEYSAIAAGILLNESPTACSNEASKKERLSKLKMFARTKKGNRVRTVLSGIRDSNQTITDSDLQQRQKRKKIRCRVMRDQRKHRGRRGPRRGKTQANPQAASLHTEEELAAQKSFVGETTNSPENSPPEESTSNLCQDARAGFTVVGLQHNEFNESGSAGSGIYNQGVEVSQVHYSSNIAADYVTGHDFEKPRFIDYLALSDQQHHAGKTDCTAISSMPDTGRLLSFGSQDLILYDPVHQQSGFKESPLCLFSGEPFLAGSTDPISAQGSSKRSTDIVPVRRSSKQLPLAKVNPDDGLQLVLYNQKRDIVVSKFRVYKKIRAKVLLDPESQRVWLQLENGAAPKADDDAIKARHWEKQRGDMRKKVELFINKMHEVQGNRKFSPWKGSIVDSVVGAFLTQNVSDHLSSSAFMSVASRFPPISKQNKLVPCPDARETFPFKRHTEVNSIPPLLERFSFSSDKELVLSEQGNYVDNSSNSTDENLERECGFAEPPVHLGENILTTLTCINKIEDIARYYEDNLTSTPNPQTLEKKQQDTIVSPSGENVSICGTLEDISGVFHQHCTVRGSRVRRMLNFGTDTNKQEPHLCSTLEPDKQISLALIQEGETVSDNLSDQQSESESAAGSSNSVHSVQDSNFQLSIAQIGTLDFDIQATTAQASCRELDVAHIDSKVSKKRPMSLSSISGMERAQLEANQKGRKRNHHGDWESVRKQALGLSSSAKDSLDSPEPRSSLHEDSVNWDAVRLAELGELADTIKERGMHHVLSGRIKAFLTSVYEEHGSIDLEWLRNLSSQKAREYLMSIHGLGVKSVECIRLLTLHHLAFPVDTNVGRICVRLGWVPIEPLPEEVQLHLVELYPIQETIQKYLWPRLCTLDQRTLYELHYQLITFGKVFCTKSKPNCNACPMRTECKHFASAYASAKPLLTGPEADQSNRICSGAASKALPILGMDVLKPALLEYPQEELLDLYLSRNAPVVSEIDSNTELLYNYQQPPYSSSYTEFIVEEPPSPERMYDDIMDIEDMGKPVYYYNDYRDYSTDLLEDNLLVDHGNPTQVTDSFLEDAKRADLLSGQTTSAQFPSVLSKDLCCSPQQSRNVDLASKIPCSKSQSVISCDSTSERRTYSTDLLVEVAQNAIIPVPEAAQIPAPKLKSVGRLRTIHYVYELPDDHSLLKMTEVDAREKDDPCSYLLAIWSPGETPESQQEIDELCRDDSSTQTIGRADESVSGTLLIPCRTAMHGSFPLNGTYFQVNEVFADHASSLRPLQVPRSLIWSLRRRFVYFGTSVPNIFKGLSTDEIKDCFWRGHVCVRGFDRRTRAPRPLVCRLHFPISKQPQKPGRGPGRKKEQRTGFSIPHT